MYFTLRDKTNGFLVAKTFQDILDILNQDRSDDWSPYHAHSSLMEIVEAIDNFTKYELMNVIIKE